VAWKGRKSFEKKRVENERKEKSMPGKLNFGVRGEEAETARGSAIRDRPRGGKKEIHL